MPVYYSVCLRRKVLEPDHLVCIIALPLISLVTYQCLGSLNWKVRKKIQEVKETY